MPFGPEEIVPFEQEAVAALRLKLQTDLWSLLHVLYPPPQYYWSETVHRPVCNFLVQKDPSRQLWEQDTIKQRLYLDPRNHFKTTIDICDMVQWILAFPNIRILIASGTRDNAIKMLKAVKAHFQYNSVLREIFSPWCPPAHKVEDFGTLDAFTCPARTERSLREPTCSVASPDSTVAGMHYDVLKFDDLVNETNSRTPEGLHQVTNWYRYTNPLLEPWGYRDVIGTRYDFSDLYGEILGEDYADDDLLGQYRNGYCIFKRSCFLADGSPIFPERFVKERLEQERRELGTFLFACQYLNTPVPGDSQFFPLALIQRAFVKETALPKQRLRFTTLDLAMSQASDADRTAGVTCSVGRTAEDPRPKIYVEHIFAGHLKPLETVEKLFEVYRRLRPINIRTEDVAFQRLLEPIVRAEGQRRGEYLPLLWMKRDNREAKEARIASLQAWFEQGDLKILDTVPHREELVLELTRFPKYRRNDIIDALADQLQNAAWMSADASEDLPDLTARSGDPRIGLL